MSRLTDEQLRSMVVYEPGLVPARYMVGAGGEHASRVGTLVSMLGFKAAIHPAWQRRDPEGGR